MGVLISLFGPEKKRRGRKSRLNRLNASKADFRKSFAHRTSKVSRSDDVILSSQLDDLSGVEFERLLALYFRDQDYIVKEVGIGGNDGGVDLVITDKRGEKTAVQAKCYADHNFVPVMTVRELVAAKRNHDCILSLLVTTSDLTAPAKKEAEQFKVDYWHGGLVAQKLKSWGKWKPMIKRKSKEKGSEVVDVIVSRRSFIAEGKAVICICGASMTKRKGREGKEFWGCSKFPNCRQTKTI